MLDKVFDFDVYKTKFLELSGYNINQISLSDFDVYKTK
jgi:trans-2-enoyl-CoA reductase